MHLLSRGRRFRLPRQPLLRSTSGDRLDPAARRHARERMHGGSRSRSPEGKGRHAPVLLGWHVVRHARRAGDGGHTR